MFSIDDLHAEAEMQPVEDHSELLSAQYLEKCLQSTNVCHNITTRGPPPKRMKHTLYTRHRTTVEPLMTDGNLQDNLKSIHTTAVNKAVAKQKKNKYLTIFPFQSATTKPTFQEDNARPSLSSDHCKLLG